MRGQDRGTESIDIDVEIESTYDSILQMGLPIILGFGGVLDSFICH